jgi:DNA-binding response OmpR family regulator
VIGLVFPGIGTSLRTLPAGVSRYLVKPVARLALMETVYGLGEQNGDLHHSRCLLVVDDDPAMLRFVEQVFRAESLEGKKFQILTSQTAAEALQILNDQPVDILLLDIDLPDQSGWEVLAQVRQGLTRCQPEVVIISALDLPNNLFVHGRAVLDLHMKRPLTTSEMVGVLKPLLNNIQPGYPDQSEEAPPEAESIG